MRRKTRGQGVPISLGFSEGGLPTYAESDETKEHRRREARKAAITLAQLALKIPDGDERETALRDTMDALGLEWPPQA